MSVEVERVWRDSRETYGSPRVTVELNMQGIRCSENYVANLMQKAGIRAKNRKRYRVTTNSAHGYSTAKNLLNRNFKHSEPNKAWVGDITYIRTKEGWLYLSVILDLHSRLVVGWSVSSRLKTQLVTDSLVMALQRRKPEPGCLFHSDRGSQYAKLYHNGVLKQFKLSCSMSRKGNCWDNAVVESFFKTLKTELFGTHIPDTRIEAGNMLMYYIEVFYNHKRLHSANGYRSPAEFETA